MLSVNMCRRLLLYFIFSGNLALCDAFNNLRIDEWRKIKAKKDLSIILNDYTYENLLNCWLL
jgi:hypothetical protein